ncbi:MAG: response regulator [Elusimicrobia bacterium]|nr:response regulator [Elusimicrobiota bacterium]
MNRKPLRERRRILLIDDDHDLVRLVASLLERAGYEVVTSPDGEQGLAQVIRESPDLVLLDLNLPGIHGFDVLTRLKQDAATRAVPVVILTTSGQPADRDRAFRLGATDYIVKSPRLATLADQVRRALTGPKGDAPHA